MSSEASNIHNNVLTIIFGNEWRGFSPSDLTAKIEKVRVEYIAELHASPSMDAKMALHNKAAVMIVKSGEKTSDYFSSRGLVFEEPVARPVDPRAKSRELPAGAISSA